MLRVKMIQRRGIFTTTEQVGLEVKPTQEFQDAALVLEVIGNVARVVKYRYGDQNVQMPVARIFDQFSELINHPTMIVLVCYYAGGHLADHTRTTPGSAGEDQSTPWDDRRERSPLLSEQHGQRPI